MAKAKILAFFTVLGLLLAACAPQAAPAPTTPGVSPPAPSPQLAAQAPAKEAWETEWERVVTAAKKEGKLIVYSSAGTEARTGAGEAFMRKYGIKLEFISGKGAEICTKLLQERRAGIYLADVYVGAGTPMVNTLKPARVLDPLDSTLILPEVLDPKAWWNGQLPWVDKDHTIFYLTAYVTPPLAINTTLVKPGEIKSYKDLLNPKWKGKIVLNDPTIDGSGHKVLSVIGWELMGVDFLRQLARQEPIVIRDQRLQIDWLARGKYPIVMPPKKDTANEFIRAGAPIDFVMPVEGSYLATGSGQVGLVNKAPHPNAARLFINWLLSREGGTAFCGGYGVQSARLDVPTENLDPVVLRQPGVKYFFGASEEFLLKGPEMTKLHEEIFGPLMKK